MSDNLTQPDKQRLDLRGSIIHDARHHAEGAGLTGYGVPEQILEARKRFSAAVLYVLSHSLDRWNQEDARIHELFAQYVDGITMLTTDAAAGEHSFQALPSAQPQKARCPHCGKIVRSPGEHHKCDRKRKP